MHRSLKLLCVNMTLETLVKLLKMHKLNKIHEQIMIHLVPEIKG
jgi:hypothetical protein